MNFHDRKEFLYSPEMFKRKDSEIAIRIQKEFVTKHSPNPPPQYFEVSRNDADFDPLWHMPLNQRTPFTSRSPISIPAINTFQKPDWRLTKVGIVPQRRDNFWLANMILQEIDYFPMRGDQVFWNGFRYMVLNVIIPPEAYWQQTGVWLGLVTECIIVPEGDAKPVLDVSKVAPAELSPAVNTAAPRPYSRVKPLPEKTF